MASAASMKIVAAAAAAVLLLAAAVVVPTVAARPAGDAYAGGGGSEPATVVTGGAAAAAAVIPTPVQYATAPAKDGMIDTIRIPVPVGIADAAAKYAQEAATATSPEKAEFAKKAHDLLLSTGEKSAIAGSKVAVDQYVTPKLLKTLAVDIKSKLDSLSAAGHTPQQTISLSAAAQYTHLAENDLQAAKKATSPLQIDAAKKSATKNFVSALVYVATHAASSAAAAIIENPPTVPAAAYPATPAIATTTPAATTTTPAATATTTTPEATATTTTTTPAAAATLPPPAYLA